MLILCKLKRNCPKLNLKINNANNIFSQILNQIKRDFHLDMLNINRNFKNFEKNNNKLKGLNLIELFIFLMIIYKSEEEYVHFFMNIELVSEFYDTNGLKNFLMNIVKKVNDNFNKKKIGKKDIYQELENKIFEYENIIEVLKENQVGLQEENENLKVKLGKKIEIINSLNKEKNNLNSKIEKIQDGLKLEIKNQMNNKNKLLENIENGFMKRIEQIKKEKKELNRKIEELNDKNEFLTFENKNFELEITKIPENYVKIQKFNKLQKSFNNLKHEITNLENNLLIENSEKSVLKDKIFKIKNDHGEKMEKQEKNYLSKISDLEKRYFSAPKKGLEEDNINKNKILKKSSFFDDFTKPKNIDEMIKNKLEKMKNQENMNLSSLTLPESIFEDFGKDIFEANFFSQKEDENQNLNESNILITDEKKKFDFENNKTLKIKNDNDLIKKLKDINKVLKQNNTKFLKGFKKVKKNLGIRNDKISFGIIFKEIEILKNKILKEKKKNSFYKKSKLKIIEEKNSQLSILYSLIINS